MTALDREELLRQPEAKSELPPARPAEPAARPWPQARTHEATAGVILTGSLVASFGSGIVTSTTPLAVDALDLLGIDLPGQRHRA